MLPRANYDQIAKVYNERYTINALSDTANAVRALAQHANAQNMLEVGCGTGRWLAELAPQLSATHGLDFSMGMLRKAHERSTTYTLSRARGDVLPYADATFDLVLCINALHHFDHKEQFVAEAWRVLKPGGVVAVSTMNPHDPHTLWSLYEYFDGTYETDLSRFVSPGQLLDWMVAVGFVRVEWWIVEQISDRILGHEIFTHHFTQKDGTSQLALLTDEAYAAGLARIRTALTTAEAQGETIAFISEIPMMMVTAWK